MTEDEAKTKWCPFVRKYPEGYNVDGNEMNTRIASAACIASACMMWVPASSPYLNDESRGICGLAGGNQRF